MFHCMSIFKKMQISFQFIRKGSLCPGLCWIVWKTQLAGYFNLRMPRTLNTKKVNCLVYFVLLWNRQYFVLLRFCFSHHLGLNIKFTANVEIKHSSTIAGVVRAVAWPLSISFVRKIFWKQVLNLNQRQQKTCKYYRFVWKGGHHTISLKYPVRDGLWFAIKTCEGDDNFVALLNEIN